MLSVHIRFHYKRLRCCGYSFLGLLQEGDACPIVLERERGLPCLKLECWGQGWERPVLEFWMKHLCKHMYVKRGGMGWQRVGGGGNKDWVQLPVEWRSHLGPLSSSVHYRVHVCSVTLLCSFMYLSVGAWVHEAPVPSNGIKSRTRTWLLCLSLLETCSHPFPASHFASKHVMPSAALNKTGSSPETGS